MIAREIDKLILDYTHKLIREGVKEHKLSFTNGFDVIFRDRVSSKKRALHNSEEVKTK